MTKMATNFFSDLFEEEEESRPMTPELECRIKPIIIENYGYTKRKCRDGNACPWRNCKFLHERCIRYDDWIKRGKTGIACNSCVNDPDSTKRPEEGGCYYDHRDITKLQTFIEYVPIKNEADLWEYFYDKHLKWQFANVFDFSDMKKSDKGVLFRSLIAAGIEHEDFDTYLEIYFPILENGL